MKNSILAIPAAPAAILPKPKIAAITATIKKVIVQRNMIKNLSEEIVLKSGKKNRTTLRQ